MESALLTCCRVELVWVEPEAEILDGSIPEYDGVAGSDLTNPESNY